MKFEKTQNRFLGKWRYEAQFTHHNQIAGAVEWLGSFSIGEWHTEGRNIYIDDLQDAFKLRIQFDHQIKLLRQAP